MWKTYLRQILNWGIVRHATCLILLCGVVLYGVQRYELKRHRIIDVTLSDGAEVEVALTYHCREALRRLPSFDQSAPTLTISRERKSGAEPINLTGDQSRRIIEALRSQRSFRHNEPCLCMPWCSIVVPLSKTESLLISFHIHPDAAISYFCGKTYESIDLAPEVFESVYKVVREVFDQNHRPY